MTGLLGHRGVLLGGDGGARVTWDLASAVSTTWTLTNDDRTATRTSAAAEAGGIWSTLGHSTGKWYFEVVRVSGTSFGTNIPPSAGIADNEPVEDTDNYRFAGRYVRTSADFTAIANGEVLMCAVDFDAHKIWYGRNGTWFNSGDPAAGTGHLTSSLPSGEYRINAMHTSGQNLSVTGNFHGDELTYSAPSGFTPWGD